MKTKVLMIITLMIVINMLFFNINRVQASGISDVVKGGDDFLDAGQSGEISIDTTKLKSTSNMLYNILLISGICIAVIISGILGIKFMIGSVEEKAQVKDALIPFIIGCVIVFGAFGFWKIFVTIGNNFTEANTTQTDTTQTNKPVTGYCSNCRRTVRINQKTGLCSICGGPVSLTK